MHARNECFEFENLSHLLAFYRNLNVIDMYFKVTFRSMIFFKSGFLGQNIGRSVIFTLKKGNIEKY